MTDNIKAAKAWFDKISRLAEYKSIGEADHVKTWEHIATINSCLEAALKDQSSSSP